MLGIGTTYLLVLVYSRDKNLTYLQELCVRIGDRTVPPPQTKWYQIRQLRNLKLVEKHAKITLFLT